MELLPEALSSALAESRDTLFWSSSPKAHTLVSEPCPLQRKKVTQPHTPGEVLLLRRRLAGSHGQPWHPGGCSTNVEKGGQLPLPQDLSTAELTSAAGSFVIFRLGDKRGIKVRLAKSSTENSGVPGQAAGCRPQLSDSCAVHPTRFQSCDQ